LEDTGPFYIDDKALFRKYRALLENTGLFSVDDNLMKGSAGNDM